MSSRLSPSTRQERLTELREVALNLLDQDQYSTWQIMNFCGDYVDRKWGLNKSTKEEYLEITKKELRDVFAQHERHQFKKNAA